MRLQRLVLLFLVHGLELGNARAPLLAWPLWEDQTSQHFGKV